MKYKQIFDRMVDMEIHSAQNPNQLETYKVLWNKLKEEIQFDLNPFKMSNAMMINVEGKKQVTK